MEPSPSPTYAVMAAFLLLGLAIYGRPSLRVAAAVAMPPLLVLALADEDPFWAFGVVAIVAFLLGQAVHRHALLRGPRQLAAFLAAALACGVLSVLALGTPAAPLVLALLPGLFAFDLRAADAAGHAPARDALAGGALP